MAVMKIRGICLSAIILFTISCYGVASDSSIWILHVDTITKEGGYMNETGQIVIPAGKYAMCYTDTFKTFAIVAKRNVGIVGIDRNENELYKVFVFDNWPDEASEGLFRIMQDGKVGYADSKTGVVVISPKYKCAFPFLDGKAKVSYDCEEISDYTGEHKVWHSDNWFYITHTGSLIK
jgi:hypothetical protein